MHKRSIVIISIILITIFSCIFPIKISLANDPPNTPNTPIPFDNAKDVDIITSLNWIGGDPNVNDTVTYDIYFGQTSPPPKLVFNNSNTSYQLPLLQWNTTYYWEIIAWDNNNVSAASPIWSFTTQQEPEYILTIIIDGSGFVQKEPNKESYKYGENVTLTANADVGWAFSTWTGDLIGSANPNNIMITRDMTVTAHFTQIQYTLTITVQGSGAVVKSPDQPSYTYGQVVTLTANPAAGWVFNHWGGDLSGSVNPMTITIAVNTSIIANFSAISGFFLNITVQGSGTVVKVPDKPGYSYGDVVTLTANPSAGWVFQNWSGNLTGNMNPVTITMDGNKSVSANFTVTSGYTLTISVQGSGMVGKTPDLPSYTYGQLVTLSPNPVTGWVFYHWSGNISGSTNPASITMNGNKSVIAYFILASPPPPSGWEPPVVPQNSKPVSDLSAGEPYKGFVNTQILFDGSRSTDSDGNIIDWYWVFGDESDGIGRIINHSYGKAGTYTVTLTVTDNAGATNVATTTCVIKQPNRPPSKPNVVGPTSGTKNTLYSYTATSTDADNDSLQYIFEWSESTTQSSGLLPNATGYTVNRSWSDAGRYSATIRVTDNYTESLSKITVYIDAVQARGAGYLIDIDGDGFYDAFYSDETNMTVTVQKKADSYLIDKDGDGSLDYVYNETSGLASYQEPRKTPGFELVFVLLLLPMARLFRKKKGIF